jgi:hypothetical protein
MASKGEHEFLVGSTRTTFTGEKEEVKEKDLTEKAEGALP